jgi:hypothetical protein
VANLSDIKPIDPVHRMQHVQHVLTLWNSQINPPEKVTPIDFIQWCNSKKIDAGWITNADEWEVYTTAKLNNYPPVDWTFQLSLPLWDETESACFIMQGVTKLQYEKKTLDDEKLNLINWFKESIKGEAIKGNIPHKVKDGVFYFVPNTAIAWAVGKHFTVIPILQDFIEGSIQYKAKLAGKTFKLEKLSESEKDYYYNLAVWSWVDAIYILQDYKPIFQLNDERVIKDFSDTAIYFRQSIDLGNIGKEGYQHKAGQTL